MPTSTLLLLIASLLALGLGVRRWPSGSGWDDPRWASGPLLPVGAALLTMILTTWIWGGLDAPGVWHDEAAYLLQAELFSQFTFAAPAPPVPSAFTQAAVLVTPVLAPKMVPGHALLLVPGIWLGLPGLMPILLLGGTAAMLVILARRLAGPAVAVLTVLVWTTQGGQQRWRASYMSESTTELLWLVGWYCLLEWRVNRDHRWLVALAVATGWGAITRPLTMLVFAIPVGVIVMVDCYRGGTWRSLAWPLVTGVALLALVPLQNLGTLGAWNRAPLALYTAQYMPFDRTGFGLDTTPALLSLSPDLVAGMEEFKVLHAEHLPSRLLTIARQRAAPLQRSIFGGWRLVLIPAAVVGLVLLPVTGWVAVGTALLLFVAYLSYAHQPHWTAYYVELMPVLALVIGIGIGAIGGWVARRPRCPVTASLLLGGIFLAAGAEELRWAKFFRASDQHRFREFNQVIAAANISRGIVFVRYAADHDPHLSLVRNVADPERNPVLTVHDGDAATNRLVQEAYPDRAAYRYDVASGRLELMGSP